MKKPRSKYPSIPVGARTGLLLFGAAFNGENDGAHLLHAGLTCEVVDTDPQRLAVMKAEYPAGWTFTQADAFEFAAQAQEEGRTWDVVSVDPFSSEEQRSLDAIEAWASLATRLVVVGAQRATIAARGPSGWHEVKRNDRWSWLVQALSLIHI